MYRLHYGTNANKRYKGHISSNPSRRAAGFVDAECMAHSAAVFGGTSHRCHGEEVDRYEVDIYMLSALSSVDFTWRAPACRRKDLTCTSVLRSEAPAGTDVASTSTDSAQRRNRRMFAPIRFTFCGARQDVCKRVSDTVSQIAVAVGVTLQRR